LRVDLYPTVINIPEPDELHDKVAVVIDVLRATTTITTALANGADTVVPVLAPEEAFAVVRENPDRRFVLGGERKSVVIPGFHLGNSPLEYTTKRVGELPVLFTTTNGTRAIRRAAPAAAVYIASFLNAPAVARELLRLGKDVAICCAGTHDQFSLEDTACGGAILEFLSGPGSHLELNDGALVAREIFRRYDGRIADLLHLAEHGQALLKLGLAEDLLFCAQLGTHEILPRLIDGQVVLTEGSVGG
jgi:2-phosphosulfolactate phosphatase